MRLAASVLLAAASLAAAPPPGEGWVALLDGRTLAGWRSIEGWQRPDAARGEWTTAASVSWDGAADPRALVAAASPGPHLVNGPKGGVTNLVTTRKFGDIELYLEFLLAAKSNSGAYLHGLYEIQIMDSYGVAKLKFGDCGGIYTRLVDGKLVGGHPPAVNASRPAGEWQSFHIRFQAPRCDAGGRKTANARFLRVVHNGVAVHENVEVDGPTHSAMPIPEAAENPLMLQGDHGPVAYRNIYFRPLGK